MSRISLNDSTISVLGRVRSCDGVLRKLVSLADKVPGRSGFAYYSFLFRLLFIVS